MLYELKTLKDIIRKITNFKIDSQSKKKMIKLMKIVEDNFDS